MQYGSFDNCFSDKRIDERCSRIIGSLFSKCVHSIRQLTSTSSEAKGFYRFLQNPKTDERLIVKDMSNRCSSACAGKVVLCIQDSSEINMYNHLNRIKKDGSLGTTNPKVGGYGFLLHPSLVVDAQTCMPYGFSHIKVWNRPEVRINKHERKYGSLPIEEKESYKWIESSKETKRVLSEASSVMIIQDREGDIYEQFASIPDHKTHLLVRASTNRTLSDKTKLFDTTKELPVQAHYILNIQGDRRKNRLKRTAKVEVKYKEVVIKRTDGSSKELPATVKMYLIEAKEVDSGGVKPICWRLLTSLPIENETMALSCIEWYSWRWMIEEVFRILKKEGFDIEASELESGKSIRKLCLLMLDVILKLFMMQIAYEQPEGQDTSAETCFSKKEQGLSEKLITTLEGKTHKQRNQHPQKSLKRHVWTIARLGGWKGYKTERPPGITTLWIGLRKFNDIKTGWLINQNLTINV